MKKFIYILYMVPILATIFAYWFLPQVTSQIEDRITTVLVVGVALVFLTVLFILVMLLIDYYHQLFRKDRW